MKYLILHTPRTGSTYLCSLLHQTAIAGIVDIERCGFSIGTEVRQVRPERYPEYVQKQTTPNGVFGAKVGMEYFLRELRRFPDVAYQILTDMDKFIWLRRRDKVAQAVSRYIATNTGRWHSESPTKKSDPDYNRFQIMRFIADIEAEEARTQYVCETMLLNPLVIWYEELIKEPVYTIHMILDFLDIPGNRHIPKLKSLYQKLDNSNKARYIDMYKKGL